MTTDWLPHIVSGLFALISGSYLYTWKSISRLWKKLDRIEHNHLETLSKRLDSVESRVTKLEE